ncbi:MAG: hypothetical protein LH632_21500 [Rhodoferax sp.]|nr:hypothetical protein [Rhodoferax sp.]
MKKPLLSLPESGPVQGEGDYDADQRYVESARAFVKAGKVADAAAKAAPTTTVEQAELERAERSGLAHSKGEDPASPQAPSR